MPTIGAPLAAGLPDAEDVGSADAHTAGTGGAQCTALQDFSFFACERTVGIGYSGVVME